MGETWVLKCADGEEYTLKTDSVTFGDESYDSVYNLQKGVAGHHGMPTTILTDISAKIAGAELRDVLRGIRTIYLPLRITGKDPIDFHHNLTRLRKSLNPATELQLWVTNQEGETRVLYCRYLKGFENAADDDKRQLTGMTIPLYVEADDPYFYDPPGAELTRNIVPDPFSAPFLTPTLVDPQPVTQDTFALETVLHVENAGYFAPNETVAMISSAYNKTCVVDSVDYVGGIINLKELTGTEGFVVGQTLEIAVHVGLSTECSIDAVDNSDPTNLKIDLIDAVSTVGFVVDQNIRLVCPGWDITGVVSSVGAGGAGTISIIHVGNTAGFTIDQTVELVVSAGSTARGLVDSLNIIDGTLVLAGIDNTGGFVSDQPIEIIVGNTYETCVVDSIDTDNHTITLKGYLRHDVLISGGGCVQVIDDTEIFVTTDDDNETRTLNTGCEYVIFWMRGCPPCYTAKSQLKALQEAQPNVTITYVEIQDADPSDEGDEHSIGMTAAKALYPEAYEFAVNCGPPLPLAYGAIDDIMPAVIVLYRNGVFIQAWCGVHTTQTDPVPTNALEDACGPRISWRVGKKYLGDNIVLINEGDSVAYPVWTINGPGKNLHLTNVSTGEEFLLVHDILLGETVVVDSRETSHTCGSTNQADFQGTGYWSSEVCPTCGGTGVIMGCPTCGVYEVCPTCQGAKTVRVWIPSASGSVTNITGMYNLRPQIEVTKRVFWGFDPGPSVIKIELDDADLLNSNVRLSLVRRYEGV